MIKGQRVELNCTNFVQGEYLGVTSVTSLCEASYFFARCIMAYK